MCQKAVVNVFNDAVMLLTCFIQRVDMYADVTEIAHMMEEVMASLYGDGMPLGHRQLWGDGNTHFCPKVMAHPTGLHLCHRLYPWDMCFGMPEFGDHLQVYPIQRPDQHRRARQPDEPQDSSSDEQANSRVGQWVSEPDA
jgi:hypothetical protein